MTFESVLESHMGLIVDRLQRTFIPDMEYEDILQEFLMVSHKAYTLYDKDISKFSTYLYRALELEVSKLLERYNRVKDNHKNESMILNRVYDDGEDILSNIISYDDVIKTNIRIDTQRAIKDIVKNKLTKREKHAIKYKYGKGYTYQEIADLEGVSIEAIDSRLRNGLRKIREGLNK